jgi:predicted RNA-binding protein with PUA-like domain
MQYWLVKTEPDVYAWDDFVKDKQTVWDGVRNYAARNHMQAMKKADKVIFYHTGDERRAVGLATVVKEAYPDPTTDDDRWTCVDLKAGKPFKKSVSLEQVRTDAILVHTALVRIGRLSVLPLTETEFNRFIELST